MIALLLLCAAAAGGQDPERRLKLPAQAFDVAFSPDGRQLAFACDEKVSVGVAVQGEAKPVALGTPVPGCEDRAAVFLPDGARVALGGSGPGLRLLDPATGKKAVDLQDAPDDVRALAVSEAAGLLAAGGRGSAIHVWDLAAGRKRPLLVGPRNTIRSLSFSADGERIAAASDDGGLWIWRVEGPAESRIEIKEARPLAVRFVGKEGPVAAAHADGSVRLWHSDSGRPGAVLRKPSPVPALSIAASPDGSLLAVGYADGRLELLEAVAGTLRAEVRASHGKVFAVAFSPDGRRLASSQGVVWDVSVLSK